MAAGGGGQAARLGRAKWLCLLSFAARKEDPSPLLAKQNNRRKRVWSNSAFSSVHSPCRPSTIIILLCCVISGIRAGVGRAILPFRVTSTEVAGWCAAGRATGLEVPGWLRSRVRCPCRNAEEAGPSSYSGQRASPWPLPHGGPSVAAPAWRPRIFSCAYSRVRVSRVEGGSLKASYDQNWEITVSLYQNLCVKTVCCKLAKIQGQSQSKTILDGRVSESLATF